MQNVFESIEEIQTQEQVDQEIKRLDSQLNKLLIIAIALATGFITSLVLMIIGSLSVNIFTISIFF